MVVFFSFFLVGFSIVESGLSIDGGGDVQYSVL
jgi:hypothetical protein